MPGVQPAHPMPSASAAETSSEWSAPIHLLPAIPALTVRSLLLSPLFLQAGVLVYVIPPQMAAIAHLQPGSSSFPAASPAP